MLMRRVLRCADRVIVHSAAEARLAQELGARATSSVALPFHPPDGLRIGPHEAAQRRLDTLGFLGFVRPYKGLDLLLSALAISETRPRLIVQGEFWEPLGRYEQMLEHLGLTSRVELRPGYATGPDMSEVLKRIDALVLPYRSATGSQQPRVAFAGGVPVIATAVGDLADQVSDGIDGLIVDRIGAEALASAIDRFYTDGAWKRLRGGVRPPLADDEWARYLAAVRGE
jgi:glycosyltransferase involved in cell wall biosynthesis